MTKTWPSSDHEGLVVAESHRATGAVVSLVAETICYYGVARSRSKIGLADAFSECGSEAYLKARHGIDEGAIERAVRDALR